jgi:hypothetical protein
MKQTTRKIVLLALVVSAFTAASALAVDVWEGKGLPDLYSHADEISASSVSVTGDQAVVTRFMAAVRSRRSGLGDELLKLVTSTKAVQAAMETKNLQKIKEATATEAGKVRLTVSCKKTPPTISLFAKNGDGKKIDLTP